METTETKKTILTNPIFKEIVGICWQEAGGTDEMDSLEARASYKQFIPEAIQKLSRRPTALLSQDEVRGLWNEMRRWGLGWSERSGKGKWKTILLNPKQFEWVITQKVRYRWFRDSASLTSPVPLIPQATPATEISPEQLLRDELVAAQSRVQDLEVKRTRFEQEINRLKELISPLQEIVEVYEGLIKLEREKLTLLQPKEVQKDEGESAVPVHTNQAEA